MEHMSDLVWYKELFGDTYLRAWAPYLTPERTARDVEDIVGLLALQAGRTILDLACGHGRIAIPLAQRGYEVTGLDLSGVFLERAKSDAESAGAHVRWVHGDMREIPFEDHFDAVISIFTSFGYLESEEEDQKVLGQVHRALKPSGLFLLEVVNRERVMRQYQQHQIDRLEDGAIVLHEGAFDFLTSRNNVRVTLIEPDGRRREYFHSVRLYTLAELVKMLKDTGLNLHGYYGGLDRSALTFESRRIAILCRRSGS